MAVASSGSAPPYTRRNPAHCSYAFGPTPLTFVRASTLSNRPLFAASRAATMACAVFELRPATRESNVGDATFRSTPTAFTADSTTLSKAPARRFWSTSC
eukprot:scaffold47392_cov60-Phaeocystis_antarctica.AAC.4